MYPIQLKVGRAYAASVVLPDGTLWILGGAGSKSILDTSEYVIYDLAREKWKSKRGPKLPYPMMSHCAALIDKDQLLLSGGLMVLDMDKVEYSSKTFLYNIR